ncbi:uncharacterized protein V6R79_000145 [Siganus canaliculatus]
MSDRSLATAVIEQHKPTVVLRRERRCNGCRGRGNSQRQRAEGDYHSDRKTQQPAASGPPGPVVHHRSCRGSGVSRQHVLPNGDWDGTETSEALITKKGGKKQVEIHRD